MTTKREILTMIEGILERVTALENNVDDHAEAHREAERLADDDDAVYVLTEAARELLDTSRPDQSAMCACSHTRAWHTPDCERCSCASFEDAAHFCEYEDCDQRPAPGSTFCAAHQPPAPVTFADAPDCSQPPTLALSDAELAAIIREKATCGEWLPPLVGIQWVEATHWHGHDGTGTDWYMRAMSVECETKPDGTPGAHKLVIDVHGANFTDTATRFVEQLRDGGYIAAVPA